MKIARFFPSHAHVRIEYDPGDHCKIAVRGTRASTPCGILPTATRHSSDVREGIPHDSRNSLKERATLAERTYDPAKSDRVIVIGGGLSGLAAAHRIHERSRALRRSVDLTVLEAKERLGGVIATERFDGFTLEGGPDSFITNKPWGLDLCERLGLGDRLIETDAEPSSVVRGAQGPARCRSPRASC